MRMGATLLIVLVALAVSVAIYFATGGRFIFFVLPLLFGLPLLSRRRRSDDLPPGGAVSEPPGERGRR